MQVIAQHFFDILKKDNASSRLDDLSASFIGDGPAHTHFLYTKGAPVLSWLVLICSGFLESVWATALSRSENFTRLLPTIIFFIACGASMAGLSFALREIPVGTGYAVWVAIGASITALWAMLTGAEPFSIVRILLILGIIACVIGLKITSPALNE